MVAAKTILFTHEQISLAHFASALSHPARIAIVTFLQNQDRASCGEIVKALPLSQPTVSQHIKTLLEAGLLLQQPVGQKIYYRLDCDRMKAFCHNFQGCIGTQEQKE